MTNPKTKPKSKAHTTWKTAEWRTARPSKTTKSKIRALKNQARKSVSQGDVLANGTRPKALEARQIQIEIADIEAQAAIAAQSRKQPASSATDQKLRKKIDTLRRKLSAQPAQRARFK